MLHHTLWVAGAVGLPSVCELQVSSTECEDQSAPFASSTSASRPPQSYAQDASLALNASNGSRVPLSQTTAAVNDSPQLHPSLHPQLSTSHYALLQTLFPNGDPGAPIILPACEPVAPQDVNSSVAATPEVPLMLTDLTPGTLAHDLLETQKEISGLKGSMATLLERMDYECGIHSSATMMKRTSAGPGDARAVRVLRSLLREMERISVLTVRLTAVVQSEPNPFA